MIHIHLDKLRDIEAIFEKEVKKGRVIGLAKFNGRKIMVLIPRDQRSDEEKADS